MSRLCLGKHSRGSVIPDEHPIPDILVVFDVFLDLSYEPGESVHDPRQVLRVRAMDKHTLSHAHSHQTQQCQFLYLRHWLM